MRCFHSSVIEYENMQYNVNAVVFFDILCGKISFHL